MLTYFHRVSFFIYLALPLHFVHADLKLDPVTKEIILNEVARSSLDELEESVSSFHDEVIETIPEKIRKQLVACDTADAIELLPKSTHIWLHDNVGQLRDPAVAESVASVAELLKFHSDDLSDMLKKTFWSRLKKMPFDYESYFFEKVIYWKENEPPAIKYSPQGLGEVKWIWKLDVESRLHGIMHVGLDVKKRNFICFERNLGVYIPEGEKLERIYREIVQVPAMARDHIGLGRESE
jgi:hypothetical protein